MIDTNFMMKMIPQERNIQLSIIIVNYNGQHYLQDCLKSIKHCCASITHEVVIVDNASSDGSQLYIKKQFSEVVLVENKSNAGFAKANNIGVKQAKGEVILLLNNDTILLNDFSSLLYEVRKKEVGAITIKMLNSDRNYTPSFGKFPKAHSLLKLANLNDTREDLVTGEFKKSEYQIDWISGSFIMVTKKDWNLIHGLDEDYFMYVEDVDFCKRLQDIGKQILFYPRYAYIHFVGFNPSRELKLINGYKIYSNKHFSALNATLAKICLHINYVYKRIFKNIR